MNQITDMTASKNYSLTVGHIGKVAEMAERLGVSQGEVVRQAIDLLWEKLDADPQSTPTPPQAQ